MPHERTLLRDRNKVRRSLDEIQEATAYIVLDERRSERGLGDLAERLVVEAHALGGDGVLAADRRVPVWGVVRAEGDLDAGGAQGGQRMLLVAGVEAQRDVGGGTYLEHRSPVSKLTYELRVLAGAHAVADPADPQGEPAADALGARPLARVDGQPEPGLASDGERVGEVLGREAGLVAAHAEPGDVGVRALDGAARDLARLLGAEVADAAHDDPALDPGLVARVVDALGERGEMLVVGQADVGGVVGRRGQLDVDRALGRTLDEVLVDDVPVVLAGADDAGGSVVGAEEVEEVLPDEPVVVADHAVGDAELVARRDPAYEIRRGRALDVDVQLGLGDAHAAVGRCSKGSWVERTLSTSTTYRREVGGL